MPATPTPRSYSSSLARARPRSRVLVLLVVAAGWICAPGCDQRVPPLPDTKVEELSQGSARTYLNEMQRWGHSLANREVREARAGTLRTIISELNEAIANDPKCPLLYSKKADILLEMSPDDPTVLDQAAELYQKSYGNDCVRAWVPGMIGMAEVYYRKAKREPEKWEQYKELAKACVEPAWAHMNFLEAHNDKPPRPKPSFFAGLFGGGGDLEPPKTRPGDPEYADEERYGILMDLLYADDAWRIDNDAVLIGSSFADKALNDSGSPLVRRLRGKLQAQKCRWFVGPGGVAADPRGAFETAIKWDKNSFDLSMELARQYRELGDLPGGTQENYTTAIEFLNRWADLGKMSNAMLQMHKPLHQELMRSWVGIASKVDPQAEPGASNYRQAIKNADACYMLLSAIDPRDAQTETIQAWSMLIRGKYAHDGAMLDRVIDKTNLAMTLPGADKEEIQTIRTLARQLLSDLAGANRREDSK